MTKMFCLLFLCSACFTRMFAVEPTPTPIPKPTPVPSPRPADPTTTSTDDLTDIDSEPVQKLYLSLRACIYQALSNNLELASYKIDPLIAEQNILSARGTFDPTVSGAGQYGLSNTPEGVGIGLTSQTQSGNYNFAYSQPTALGTLFQLNGNAYFSNSFAQNAIYSPGSYSTFAGITITQPLLKGFGTDINLAPIRIAQHGLSGARANLRFQAEQIITSVLNAYDDLIFAQDNRDSELESLQLARSTLESNIERFKIGVMSPLDVAQAHAEAATRLEAVITARQAFHTQENILKRLISKDFASLVGISIVPLDLPPELFSKEPLLGDMSAALKNRGDYQQEVEELKQNEIQTKVAKNGVLPQLNIVGNYGYNGLSPNLTTGINQLTSARYPAYSLGLTVQFPIGDRTAIAQRRIALLQQDNVENQILALEQNILVQVDDAVEGVETDRKKLVTAKAAMEFAKQSLEAEQQKLEAGTSTTYLVLQMQRDYSQAKTNDLQAVADLRKAETQLLQTEGLILQKYFITIDPITDNVKPAPKTTRPSPLK